ncbi:DNA cross-link repair 1A protein [Tremella mesenterica]|uniref:DNA cross-link repair 1A protein n=1 Tax=Tremella mesenterica TaxID=5217 RepID=A0A4Q1BCN0_TREME|nr:DNA cross-link repair 1A protein [Tremella mesenterica]
MVRSRKSSHGKTVDIAQFFSKPESSTPARNTKLDRTLPSCPPNRPVAPVGKVKKRPSGGSETNPLIISDDEVSSDVQDTNTTTKTKRKTSPVSLQPDTGESSTTSSSAVEKETVDGRRPFVGLPNSELPPTWPNIVNTAEQDIDEVDDASDGLKIDLDTYDSENDSSAGNVSIDEDERQKPEGEKRREEKEVVELQPHIPDGRAEQDLAQRTVDLSLDWIEGDEEGMGMEEEEEDFELQSRERRKARKVKVNEGTKMTECPICGVSLKGKVDTVITHHINTCLDSSHIAQPISSFDPSAHSAPPNIPSPPTPQTKGPNAFSVLMSGHKEREQWKDAEADLKRDGKRFAGRRPAPFYKVMTGMPVAVDAFRYGAIPKVTAYLLTHAHSDHYTNLSRSWNHGPIYCSETTANLIIHMLGVEPKWVHGLPNDIPFEMPNTGSVTVTPMEANHCPGSSIFLFEGRQTVNAGDSGFTSPYVGSKRVFRYLHCGDFRACPKMVLHPAIAKAKIDTCYLDTTYLNPKYCFPPQPLVIEACATLARKTVRGLLDTAPPLLEQKPNPHSLLPSDTSVLDVKPSLANMDDDGDPELEVKSEIPDYSSLNPAPQIDEDVKLGVKVESGNDIYAEAALQEEKSKGMMQSWLVKREEPEGLEEVKEEKTKGRTLVVMGTYSIGKERIVKAVAKALGTTIYCDPRKKAILLCQTDPELHSLLSTDPVSSMVHLLPLGNIQLDRLQEYLTRLHPHFDRVLGFRPTGWSYSPPAGTDLLPDVNTVIRRDQSRGFTDAGLKPMRGSCRQYMMYGVPYSEHSSFFELTCFALSLPGPELKMIATVNVGNEKSRAKMKKWFEKWLAEKARRREKGLPSIVDYRDETHW